MILLHEFTYLPIIVLGAVTSAFFLFTYIRRSDSYLLLGAAGWAMLAMYGVDSYWSMSEYIGGIFLYGFALSITLFVLKLVEIHSMVENGYLKLFLLIPSVHVVYKILLILGIGDAGVGGLAGDSGAMLVILAYIVHRRLKRGSWYATASLVLLGVILFLHKFLHGTVIEFTGMALSAFGLSFFTVSVTSNLFKAPKVCAEPSLGAGLIMAFDCTIADCVEKFREVPALAFVRTVMDFPESWTVFYISGVKGRRAVSPTSLEKIGDMAVTYMREARQAGFRAVVVLEGLEYLKLYNDFKALLKLLYNLRDHALIEQGTVIVLASKNAWEEKELFMLKNVADNVGI